MRKAQSAKRACTASIRTALKKFAVIFTAVPEPAFLAGPSIIEKWCLMRESDYRIEVIHEGLQQHPMVTSD